MEYGMNSWIRGRKEGIKPSFIMVFEASGGGFTLRYIPAGIFHMNCHFVFLVSFWVSKSTTGNLISSADRSSGKEYFSFCAMENQSWISVYFKSEIKFLHAYNYILTYNVIYLLISTLSFTMALLPTLIIVLLSLRLTLSRETYSDKYDNVNVDLILKSERLLNRYMACILDEGPCSPDGKYFRG